MFLMGSWRQSHWKCVCGIFLSHLKTPLSSTTFSTNRRKYILIGLLTVSVTNPEAVTPWMFYVQSECYIGSLTVWSHSVLLTAYPNLSHYTWNSIIQLIAAWGCWSVSSSPGGHQHYSSAFSHQSPFNQIYKPPAAVSTRQHGLVILAGGTCFLLLLIQPT